MQLQSMRLGFATNSSSSHSVVVAEESLGVAAILANYDGTRGEVNFPEESYNSWGDLNSIVNYGIEVILKRHPFFIDRLKAASAVQGRYKYLDWNSFQQATLDSELTPDTKALLVKSGQFIWERGYSGHTPYVQSEWGSKEKLQANFDSEVNLYGLEKQSLAKLEKMFWFFICNTERVEAGRD